MGQIGNRRQQESYCSWNKRRRCSRYNPQTQKDERLKVVLDTNILISASFWFGNPRQIIDFAFGGKFLVYSSDNLIQEYKNSIIRDFAETLEGAEERANFFLAFLEIVEPKEKVLACEDLDDNKVLEVALEVKANYIVSGDKHLLKMQEFRGMKILNAKDFLDLLGKSSP
ncbi:MAG: putative toxin-antitoxin system toxin component, PIN family [archaeon]|jgi:putative PIN family toxin of toxin-antitoxin system